MRYRLAMDTGLSPTPGPLPLWPALPEPGQSSVCRGLRVLALGLDSLCFRLTAVYQP